MVFLHRKNSEIQIQLVRYMVSKNSKNDAARFAASALSALGAVLAISAPPEAKSNELDQLDSNIGVVLTPSRLRQSLADVPASVTVITAEMIKRFGILTIPDALRMVPGMAITQVSGNDYRINYHGTNGLLPRRMNVLIDGVSVYRPAISLARVDWLELPVDIDDVERIEVTRGSDSATYGANSMLAIVNVITKHPKDVEGTTLTATVGSLNTRNGSARYAGKIGDSTAFRITLSRQQDTGYDYASTFGQGHDSTRLNKFNFRSVTDLASDETLDLQAMAVQGVKEIEFIDKYQKTNPDAHLQDYYVNAVWKKSISPNHTLQIQAYASQHYNDQSWTTCPPAATLLPEMFNLWRANPLYANTILSGRIPTGGTANDNALAKLALAAITKLGPAAKQLTCAVPNQNFSEGRYNIELQDTFVFSDELRMVSGMGVRRDFGNSDSLLGGSASNNTYSLFSNLEYKPNKWFGVNLGGYLERDQITGFSFSPRVALNTHLTDNQTVRFVVSKGERMPGIMEQRASWTYKSPVGNFYQSAVSPGNLLPEQIISREIGYLLNLPEYGLIFDAKVFDDKLYDLISEKLQISDFKPTNKNWVHLRGAELQANYEPNEQWMGFLTYSYLTNDASTLLEQTQSANKIGSIGVTHALQKGWRVSLASYGSSSGSLGQSFYGREDLTLANTKGLAKGARLTSTFTIRHLDNRSSQYFVDYNNYRLSRFDDAMQYFVSLQLAY